MRHVSASRQQLLLPFLLLLVAIATMLAIASPSGASGHGSISGTVTDGGEPLEGICIHALIDFGDGRFGAAIPDGMVYTDADGRYEIPNLADGDYHLRAALCPSEWVAIWHDGEPYQTSEGPVDPIVVDEGEATADVDFELLLGASIAGSVIDEDGSPVEGVCVQVGSVWMFASSDSDGDVLIEGLVPESEVILAAMDCGPLIRYGGQFYDGVESEEDATPVQVGSAGTVTELDNPFQMVDFVRGGGTPPPPPPPPPPESSSDTDESSGIGGSSTEPVLSQLAPVAAERTDEGTIHRLYVSVFGRVPDDGGLQYWIDQHEAGMSLTHIARHFADSAEFEAMIGLDDDAAFLTALYQHVFHRDPDPGGFAYWMEVLSTGQMSRAHVILLFADSNELVARIESALA